jgi:D-alanyl-D-alanine carboxypeptidase
MLRTPVVTLVFLWTPALLSAQPRPLTEQQFAQLRQKVQTTVDNLRGQAQFPGITAGFALADGRSAGVSAGFADVESKTPLKPSDRMLAGSVGKTFVAALLLQLVDDGKVGLDDKLEKWLGQEPWFARLPNGRDLTIRTLMTHSSGLPEYFEVKGAIETLRAAPYRVWKPAELVTYILDAKPLFAAGQGWAYADTNYILVGMVVERATGRALYDEVTRRLLKPLKLERTIPSDRRDLPETAVGYSMPRSPFGVEGRMIVNGKFLLNPQFEWAGEGFASTPEDLARWAKALYEGRFHSPETVVQMLTGVDASQGRGSGPGQEYGLGVQIRESPWGMSYGHGGWFPGYRTEVEYFPKFQTAIAVQFNTDAGRSIGKGLRAYIGDVAKVVLANTD